ncbi:DUF2946 domain-containing protein [Vreelandella nanhaiensis]
MCLLFAGPLISQLQASQHAYDHQGHGHHGHSASVDRPGRSADRQAGHPVVHQTEYSAGPPGTAINSAPISALSDWHNQCGYCELWQHSPSLSLALPAIASDAFIVLGGRFLASQAGALFQYNYPHALTRGPPYFIYRSLKHYTRVTFIVTRIIKKGTGLLGFFKV